MKQIVIFLLLTITACSPAAVKKPSDLIEEGKMIKILADIHLAEGRVSKLNLQSNDSSQMIYQVLEKRIFKKYQIDTTAYRQSYRYYLSQPDDFNEIYKKVVKDLEAREKSGK